MRTKLEKMRNKINRCAFDVAAGPLLLMLFGVPLLLAVIVAGLVFLAVRAVIKISREKKREDNNQ